MPRRLSVLDTEIAVYLRRVLNRADILSQSADKAGCHKILIALRNVQMPVSTVEAPIDHRALRITLNDDRKIYTWHDGTKLVLESDTVDLT